MHSYNDDESAEEILCVVGGGDIRSSIVEPVGIYLRENNAAHSDEEGPVEVGEDKDGVDSE